MIIHGTASSRTTASATLKDAGGKLVWSPQSNLRLYGQTTPAAKALELGIPMGLGADWLPSGSQSLLAELSVARRTLARQGASGEAVDRKLVRMVTSEAAEIAGAGGRARPARRGAAGGRPRARAALRGPVGERRSPPSPSWVELVTIGGDLAYGRADWVGPRTDSALYEPLVAWGKQMLLDTSFAAVGPSADGGGLGEIRKKLTGRYPQTGPIFA